MICDCLPIVGVLLSEVFEVPPELRTRIPCLRGVHVEHQFERSCLLAWGRIPVKDISPSRTYSRNASTFLV